MKINQFSKKGKGDKVIFGLLILSLLVFSFSFSSALNIGESNSGGVNIEFPDTPINFSTVEVNASELWMTSIGVLDDTTDITSVGTLTHLYTSGNVGIGTTSPVTLLNIYSANTNHPAITLTAGEDTTYDPIIYFQTGASPTTKFTLGVDNADDKFKIYSGTGVGGTSEFVFDSSGNVGIGDTTPSQKLDVAGDMQLQGDLLFSGSGVGLKQGAYVWFVDIPSGATLENERFGSAWTYNTVYNAGNATWQAIASGRASALTLEEGRFAFYGSDDMAGTGENVTWNPRFYIQNTGNIGVGTSSPGAKLHVNSTSGVSIYAEQNISAEDYLYHSPFPDESYLDSQALLDLIKVSGTNGKLNHSTLPKNAQSIQNIPIYETIIKEQEFERELCDEVWDVEINETILECYNETYLENVSVTNQIGTRQEPQASVGMMIGNIIKSIKRLYNWNTEQDNKIKQLEDELCIMGRVKFC